MSRLPRQKSESGIYHIILRGLNRQDIFHDDRDRVRFLETIYRYKRITGLKVYGWCLMDNHVHLLFGEGNESISITMKRILVSFAFYYHQKYDTGGHLFQDRFSSEAVNSDTYLTTVLRYIHQNPVKAGIVTRPAEWRWSSCLGYYGEKMHPQKLLDWKLVLDMVYTNDKEKAIEAFKIFNEAENEDKCLEDASKRKRLTDEEFRAEILKRIPGLNIVTVKSMPKKQRDEILVIIKQIKGLSQRQAARILGISPNLVFKVK